MIESIGRLETILKKLVDMKIKGRRVVCTNCHKSYREIPFEVYDDGNGIRKIPMCGCGSGLFINIESDISKYWEELRAAIPPTA